MSLSSMTNLVNKTLLILAVHGVSHIFPIFQCCCQSEAVCARKRCHFGVINAPFCGGGVLFFLQSFLHATKFLHYSRHLCMYPVWPHFTLGQMFPVAQCGRKTYRSKNMSNRWRETEQERKRKVCLWKTCPMQSDRCLFPLPVRSHTVTHSAVEWKPFEKLSKINFAFFIHWYTVNNIINKHHVYFLLNKYHTNNNNNTQILLTSLLYVWNGMKWKCQPNCGRRKSNRNRQYRHTHRSWMFLL